MCIGTCPSNLGTALRATITIKLPGMAKLMEDKIEPGHNFIHKVCKKFDLSAAQVSNDEHVFNITNTRRLGFYIVSRYVCAVYICQVLLCTYVFMFIYIK